MLSRKQAIRPHRPPAHETVDRVQPAPQRAVRRPLLSLVIPTRNERDNVEPLLLRLRNAVSSLAMEVVFVDDSDDGTPDRIREVARQVRVPTSVRARPAGQRAGGLGGAVVEGFRAAEGDWLCVMDGDLQHPPELIPSMLEKAEREDVDLVLGSRLAQGGSAEALGPIRYLISRFLALGARLLFPRALRKVTDPLSGFFLLRRTALDLDLLKPRGFKILLEILVRFPQLEVAEVPFRFDSRRAGETKAGVREILRLAFLMLQLRLDADLRFPRFAVVGASGFVVNNALLALLTELLGVHYLLSAVMATQGSSLWNFTLSSSWVFSDRQARGTRMQPLAMFLLMNNMALVLRVPLMFVLTSGLGLHYVVSNIASIAVMTFVRFTLCDRWIWSQKLPRRHTYAIHDIVRISSDVVLPELEGFRANVPEEEVDLRVHVRSSGRGPVQGLPGHRSIRYHEGLGPLGFAVQIDVGERIEVWASALLWISPHVLYTNIVEPILRWTFVSRGYALVHGACVAVDSRAYLVTAETDTGKTTTMLRLLKELGEAAFIADDLTLVTPGGRALTYPKPLTISRHTVRAVNSRTLSLGERLALHIQSKVHSRSGRRLAKWMTRLRLPMATVNAVAQFLVPPPKYPVQRLIPGVQAKRSAHLSGLFVIERHGDGESDLDHDKAIAIVLRNCEDAYGFPPYDAIEGFLCSLQGMSLRSKEQSIIEEAFRSCPAIRIRSRSYGWADRIATLLQPVVQRCGEMAPGAREPRRAV